MRTLQLALLSSSRPRRAPTRSHSSKPSGEGSASATQTRTAGAGAATSSLLGHTQDGSCNRWGSRWPNSRAQAPPPPNNAECGQPTLGLTRSLQSPRRKHNCLLFLRAITNWPHYLPFVYLTRWHLINGNSRKSESWYSLPEQHIQSGSTEPSLLQQDAKMCFLHFKT